jgi:quercetin dioxygenase-like cupin family protein
MAMKLVNDFPSFVRALPEVDLPFPGARGWMLQGSGQQVVFAQFEEDLDVPEHSHAEQWEFCLAGSVLLRRGSGEEEIGAGENFYIPAGLPHSASVHAGYKAMMIFNAPDRYKTK